MTDMGFRDALRRHARALAFWALAGVALLVAHDAIFLAQVGPGAELTRTLRGAAHDYWGVASAMLLLAGIVAGAVVAWRIRRLRRTAADFSAPPVPARRSMRRVLALWARLFAVVAVGFAIQENIEHLAGHGHLLGAGALLGPEYPLALPVIGLITLLGASLAGRTVGVERALVMAIAIATTAARRRAPRVLRRAPIRLVAGSTSVLARAGAGRAPPPLLAERT